MTRYIVVKIRVGRRVRKSLQPEVFLPMMVIVDTEKTKQIWDIFNRQSQQDFPTASLDMGYEEERRKYR